MFSLGAVGLGALAACAGGTPGHANAAPTSHASATTKLCPTLQNIGKPIGFGGKDSGMRTPLYEVPNNTCAPDIYDPSTYHIKTVATLKPGDLFYANCLNDRGHPSRIEVTTSNDKVSWSGDVNISAAVLAHFQSAQYKLPECPNPEPAATGAPHN